jgi:hypothetical protein
MNSVLNFLDEFVDVHSLEWFDSVCALKVPYYLRYILLHLVWERYCKRKELISGF